MKLKKLIAGLNLVVKGSKEVEITGLSSDSRKVSFGNLFFAKRGKIFDGTQFIPQAIFAGAAAVVTDIFDPFLKGVQIICSDVAKIEPLLAARYYQNPSERLFVVGITGTKGKTTTSYLIKHLLDFLDRSAGLIGTVETIIGKMQFFSELTTEGPIFNQKWLKEMVLQQCKSAVIEVSSHGLEQRRVESINFDVAVFTNLFPDHLDYHKTIRNYAAAKKKLFEKAKDAVLNADSDWANFMGKGLTFGIERGDLLAKKIEFSAKGTSFDVDGCSFFTPFIGRFNVYNALACIGVGVQMGVSLSQISQALSQAKLAPCRIERIGNVFIDFAHTGDALKNVLEALKEIAQSRIIVVFGCGGDRDPSRRVGMAQAADRFADVAILTDDNPRKEDPLKIICEIKSGFQRLKPLVEQNRKKAIEKALFLREENDLILIAGKGHEKEQIFADRSIPFADKEIVKELLTL